ncbi:hypothetical protein FRB97_002974 [Tulasnella sp. 331]|nr:hypothetical protein FRB97_002974 [Tulasnella sp. 331]KAG8891096.1 hypothetical protein FRB98_000105 [Tulasnella sp. 332]
MLYAPQQIRLGAVVDGRKRRNGKADNGDAGGDLDMVSPAKKTTALSSPAGHALVIIPAAVNYSRFFLFVEAPFSA